MPKTESKEKFPKDMAKWIEDIMPDYEAQLKSASKADVLEWKKKKKEEFEAHFGSALSNVDKWGSRFDRKFLNHNRDLKEAALKSNTTTRDITPLLLQDQPRTSGRKLFEQERSREFSEQANTIREARGEKSTAHAGHWQTIAAEAWKNLSGEERAHYEDKAQKANSEVSKDIYSSQEKMPLMMFKVLTGLLGMRDHQIGRGAFHLLYAFRDSDEVLQLGKLQIIDSEEFFDKKFDECLPGYDKYVSKAWSDYCTKAVGPNRSVALDELFEKNEHGHYILPPYDEETQTVAHLRQQLTSFFDGNWALIWPHSSDMPAVPWAELISHPSDYFHPILASHLGFSWGRLDQMKGSELQKLSAAIIVFQEATAGAYCIFLNQRDILDSRSRRAESGERERLDAKDVEEIHDEDRDHPTPTLLKSSKTPSNSLYDSNPSSQASVSAPRAHGPSDTDNTSRSSETQPLATSPLLSSPPLDLTGQGALSPSASLVPQTMHLLPPGLSGPVALSPSASLVPQTVKGSDQQATTSLSPSPPLTPTVPPLSSSQALDSLNLHTSSIPAVAPVPAPALLTAPNDPQTPYTESGPNLSAHLRDADTQQADAFSGAVQSAPVTNAQEPEAQPESDKQSTKSLKRKRETSRKADSDVPTAENPLEKLGPRNRRPSEKIRAQAENVGRGAGRGGKRGTSKKTRLV